MKKTAVVILNWNGRKLLEQFLATIVEHTVDEDTELIVADNGSTDDSVDYLRSEFADVPLIVLDQNYGFAEGYNRAIAQVEAEYVVLLNSDIETTEGWLTSLVDYLDRHKEVAAVQPKILDYKQQSHFEYAGASGGFIDRYGYPFCRGRILGSLEEDKGQYDSVVPVFWATGAALAIRKKDYDAAGGLDGRFFAHMEEIDLCWRLNARGRGVMVVPESVVYHVGGASLSSESPHKTYLNFRNNMLMLYKNLPKKSFLKIFVVRFFLDLLAMAHLVVQGKLKNAWAVVRAHVDFYGMKADFRADRKENLEKRVMEMVPTRYYRPILLDYYLRGRKTFASLKWG